MLIKQKYPIDFAKSITWLVVLGLIYYFNQFDNITAWIYFCLHGSYGIMWVMKSKIFPDKNWEKKAGILYTILIIFGLMVYWAPAFIITMNSHEASLEVIVSAIILFSFGIYYHFASDMQKYIYLKYNSGLITDGLWEQCRHPNYFGETILWWGIYLIAVGGEAYWTVVGPALLTFLLLRISGVTLLEKGLNKSRPDYHKYVETTSPFILWPPKNKDSRSSLASNRKDY